MTTPFVPKDTFIHEYMQYMGELETPTIYDFACACWILSNALGRNVVINRPGAPVFMNMYLILVSESGIMRKSTSIRSATAVLREFFESVSSSTMLVESKTTPELILDDLNFSSAMNSQAHMVFIASELAASFGRSTGVSTITALLTDLYDCPERRTGGGTKWEKNKVDLKSVYMSFIGGTTPTWLNYAVTPTIVQGGFTSRCYFVVGRVRKRIVAWPTVQVDETAQRARLQQRLKVAHENGKKYPKIELDDGARRYFTNWYTSRTLHRDMYRESFEAREDGHILRIAGLFAVNEDEWIISSDHIQRSIHLINDIKSDGASLFVTSNASDADIRWIHRLREILIKAGDEGVAHGLLSRMMSAKGMRSQELRSTLHVMHELDLISKYQMTHGEGKAGRPKTIYKPTIYLKNEAFLSDVVRKLGLDE